MLARVRFHFSPLFSHQGKSGHANDSLSFPFGYEVDFNAERGYIDSLFFLPIGPYIRIRTMAID